MKLKYVLMALMAITMMACRPGSESSSEKAYAATAVSAQGEQDKKASHPEGNEKRRHDKKGKARHKEGKESASHDEGREGKGEHGGAEGGEERGEHARDSEGGGEGEEDGTTLSLATTYDKTKHGVRLILKYNKERNAFVGTVENVTRRTIQKVRVEVHLSNGKELGPTKPINLGAGTKRIIELRAKSTNFDGWSTHAEVGNSEHGGNGEGSHGSEKEGEHN